MKKLFSLIIFWFFPVSFVLIITFIINIFVQDFRYAHQSHSVYQPPLNWHKYLISTYFKKIFVNTFDSKKIGLPQVHIYIDEQSKEKLLSKTPNSTKNWVSGNLLNNKGNFQKIQIRYRGDNPQNWLLEKKNLRIKIRKKDMQSKRRYFEYSGFDLEFYPTNNIAKRMKLMTSNSKLVELFINGKSSGVYTQDERFDENFLRRNKIMPINMYKGENHNTERKIGIDPNLYNNPGLWDKTAIFNQKDSTDKSDLIKFLELLHSAEVREKDFIKFLDYIDLETWSNYAAFIILAKSYQSDHFHNVRIALDPWNGQVYPIVQDPHPVDINQDIYTLEYSTNDLLTLLNKSSIFLDKKYEKLFYHTFKSKILSKEIDYLDEISEEFFISLKRDPEINLKEMKKKIEVLKKDLEITDESIKKIFIAKPLAGWKKNKNNLSIYIYDKMPITNVELVFEKDVPKWIAFDTNYNGVIEEDELKFTTNGKKNVLLPVKLYSNRVSFSKRKNSMFSYQNFKIDVSPTKFNIISEKNIQPNKIFVQKNFSKEKFILNYSPDFAAIQANKFNQVITQKNMFEKNPIYISGEIQVDENLIFDSPVVIKPGTEFFINEGTHLIFKDKVIANGTIEEPIKFKRFKNSKKPWGTLALIGRKTANSKFSNIIIDGGSGGNYNEIIFTSMFSLHNTQEINLKNLKLINHSKYDDMMHVIYCKDIIIDGSEFFNASGDAIDVDVSKNIKISNSKFLNAKNDGIDFMESEAIVDTTVVTGSEDKGISVGESSNIIVNNSQIKNNNIGIATKDRSNTHIINVNFINNKIQLSAYRKNWQYGGGGSVNIYRSYFDADENFLEISKESNLLISDSSIFGDHSIKGKNLQLQDVDFFSSSNEKKKKIIPKDINFTHPMFSQLKFSENQYRGNDLIE